MNSSRGEVVDGDALLRSGHPCVLDVWEHEPHLDPQLLDRTLLATPHVAGYSEQGKATATAMSVATLAGFFGLPLRGWYPLRSRPSVPRPISWQELLHDHPRRLTSKPKAAASRRGPPISRPCATTTATAGNTFSEINSFFSTFAATDNALKKMYRRIIKPILFSLTIERAHHVRFCCCASSGSYPAGAGSCANVTPYGTRRSNARSSGVIRQSHRPGRGLRPQRRGQ